MVLYDALNLPGADYAYWVARVAALQPEALVDLGCGTGQLPVLLARPGSRRVLGVDPDPEMLAVARQRDGHELVQWVEGDAGVLPTAAADLVTMTGHVSQVFLEDDAWLTVLRQVRRALRPGGHLLFDMRNPPARAWERWTPTGSRRRVEGDDGPVDVWHQVTSVRDGRVAFDTTTSHVATGVRTTRTSALRFRTEGELWSSLSHAGFEVVEVHGGWDGTPVNAHSPELLVLARSPG